MLFVLTGVVAYSDGPDLLAVLAATYVIIFGCILFSAQLKLKFFDRLLVSYAGFLMRFRGQAFFIVFLGTLCFGLGDLGIVVGIWALLVVILNSLFLFWHPTLSTVVAKETELRTLAVGGAVGASGVASSMGAVHSNANSNPAPAPAVAPVAPSGGSNPSFAPKKAPPKPVAPAQGGNDDDVEVYTDEETGLRYQYTKSTGETKWLE